MSIKWYQLLFQIINFGILVFVLNKFLYSPIVKIIQQRNKKIEEAIKAAEDNLKEKAKIQEIKKKAVQEAEKEAVIIIEKAKKQAKNTGKDIIDDAKKEAEQEVDKKFQLLTEKLSEQERQIQSKMTKLVVSTTAKLLKDAFSQKEQQTILDREIKKLKKAVNQ